MIATREGDRNYYYDKGIADEREVFVRYYADRVRSRIGSGMTREAAVESLSMPNFVLDQVLAELHSTD